MGLHTGLQSTVTVSTTTTNIIDCVPSHGCLFIHRPNCWQLNAELKMSVFVTDNKPTFLRLHWAMAPAQHEAVICSAHSVANNDIPIDTS